MSIPCNPYIRNYNYMEYLNINIQLGQPEYVISNTEGEIITGQNMLNNFIIRQIKPENNDRLDTSTNIIQALRDKCILMNNRQTQNGIFSNGTSFSWKMYNSDPVNTISLDLNDGILSGNSLLNIKPKQATEFLMIITNQKCLGDDEDRITIINLDS
jgi:hypothetical protein